MSHFGLTDNKMKVGDRKNHLSTGVSWCIARCYLHSGLANVVIQTSECLLNRASRALFRFPRADLISLSIIISHISDIWLPLESRLTSFFSFSPLLNIILWWDFRKGKSFSKIYWCTFCEDINFWLVCDQNFCCIFSGLFYFFGQCIFHLIDIRIDLDYKLMQLL